MQGVAICLFCALAMRATCKKQTVGYTGIMLWCQNSNLVIDFLACRLQEKTETNLVEKNLIEKKIYKSHSKKILQVKLSAFCNTTSEKAKACKFILTVGGRAFYGDY